MKPMSELPAVLPRRIFSLLKLAGGGAIIATSLAGVGFSIMGSKTTLTVDVIAASAGAVITFLLLARLFQIFGRHPNE